MFSQAATILSSVIVSIAKVKKKQPHALFFSVTPINLRKEIMRKSKAAELVRSLVREVSDLTASVHYKDTPNPQQTVGSETPSGTPNLGSGTPKINDVSDLSASVHYKDTPNPQQTLGSGTPNLGSGTPKINDVSDQSASVHYNT